MELEQRGVQCLNINFLAPASNHRVFSRFHKALCAYGVLWDQLTQRMRLWSDLFLSEQAWTVDFGAVPVLLLRRELLRADRDWWLINP